MTALPVSLEAVNAELARRSLPEFIRQAWEHVEPETELVWNWHLDELCDALHAVSAGEIKRLIVNVPPGSAKSLMVSVFWPAWEWARDASKRYLAASYSDAVSIRDNRRLRGIVQSEWYSSAFGVELSSDQTAKRRFDTTRKGWRIATSVGGAATGEHPDRIIIDDPHTADQARSDVERQRALDWFDRTIATRIAKDPAMVLVMQRLHEDDLAGHLVRRGGWEQVCFPMRFEPDRADPRDHRTEAGELLWPDLFPEEKVRQEELDLGPFGAAGQLQQRPSPEGGGLFQREWFGYVDEPPVKARRCRGWDTAGTEASGDWTVGVRLAVVDGIYYVEDVARDQLGPGGVDALMRASAELDGKECSVREEQEPGASGKAVIADRTKKLAGWDYSGVPVSGDKVTRAKPFRAQCEAGNVKLVRGDWNEEYVREMCSFPVGRHDDQVDASSCAFNALVMEEKPDREWRARVMRGL